MPAPQPSTSDLLARLLHQARRARESYSTIVDPAAAIAARREVNAFLEDHLDWIRAAAEAGPPVGLAGPLPVFSYWDSGVQSAPPLVRACLGQLSRVHPEAIILDRQSVGEHIDIPPIVADRLAGRPAHFSDYVRASLLERFGGIWVDATCFVPAPLTQQVIPLMSHGTFYLRWSGTQISNWFIASDAHDPLIALQRAALEAWWTHNDRLPDYFLYHRVFEALNALLPAVRRRWRSVPRVSTIPSHVLQLAMFRPYDQEEFEQLLSVAFVHKLSYKFDPDAVPADSILARLIGDT